MNYDIYPRFALLLITCCFLLVSCGVTSTEYPENSMDNAQSNDNSANATESSPASMTTKPTTLATVQEAATPTVEIIAENTPQSPLETTIAATSTGTPSSSPTHTSEPTPTTATVECKNDQTLPVKAFPTEIDMRSGRIAVDSDYLYLAAQQYIGVFNISVSESPEFLGFWEFPDLLSISAIAVNKGIVYVGSDSTLQVLNTSPQCHFETIFREEVSIQIYQLELEDGRLYVGGVSENDGTDQVIIISSGEFTYQELDKVNLGEKPATWSVFEETLYSLSGDKLLVTDVSDPHFHVTQTVNLALDSEAVLFSPRKFVKDTLYLLLQERGEHKLTIVSDLKAATPTIIQDPLGYGFGTSDVFRVHNNYIFVGNNSCDVSCASVVTIIDVQDGQRLSRFSLQPHYPIYLYHEVSEDLVYAFSNVSLLVVNVSNLDKPEITFQYSFIP